MTLTRRMGRSLFRIVAGVVIVGGAGFAALVAVLRQPTLTAIPFESTLRAGPVRLRRHVDFLTTDVRPRGAANPENLERAARYIEEQFRRAGARTSRQRFVARKRSYSNVIGAFGPDASSVPLLVVGAHYDAFTET